MLFRHLMGKRAAMIDWVRRTVVPFFRRRWVRFGIVGGLSTITYWSIGLGLHWWGMLPVLVNNALAYGIGFSVSYVGHRTWTFQSHGSHRSQLPKFALAQGVGLGLNTCIIATLMHWGMSYTPAMVIATFSVPVVIYFISRFWVFRETSRMAAGSGISSARIGHE